MSSQNEYQLVINVIYNIMLQLNYLFESNAKILVASTKDESGEGPFNR